MLVFYISRSSSNRQLGGMRSGKTSEQRITYKLCLLMHLIYAYWTCPAISVKTAYRQFLQQAAEIN